MIFMIHPDIPLEKKMLQKEDVKRVLDFSYVTRDSTNPFIQQEELYLSAERYFKEGFYRDSVMNVQTMIEEFLRTLHIHLILSEGKSEAEVATIRENMPFISMVKQEFHERIGGSWQINNQNTAVGNWYTKTYSLRNRVSHSGYFPTYYEAREALDAAIELRNYVIALIKRKRKLTP
jgi:hypothetical protein